MEPVDEATQYRRRIDDTIARFSAAHDEWEAEEAERKERRGRFTAGPARLIEQTRTRLQRITIDDDQQHVPADPAAGTAAEESSRAAQSPKGTESPQKDEEPSTTSRSQRKKPGRISRVARALRISAGVLAVLVFAGTATAWGAKEWFNAQFDEVAALDTDSKAIHNGDMQVDDENFLVVGSDTRQGVESGEGVGNASDIEGARSDSVMVVHIPEDRNRVVGVSFLRDLEVDRPSCQQWDSKTSEYSDNTVPAAEDVKLNTAYAVGGPKCVTKLIQQLTHMRIQHFVGIDFDGFKNIVATVGGVTVNVQHPIVDGELGTVIDEPGETELDSDQALQFMRARKVEGDPTADYGRVGRQQQFIGALLDKTMSKDVLFNTDKLTGLVDSFTDATFGENIGFDQLLTLGQSMRHMSSGDVDFRTVPTTGEANARGNEVLLEDKADALFTAMIHGRPIPGEQVESSA